MLGRHAILLLALFFSLTTGPLRSNEPPKLQPVYDLFWRVYNRALGQADNVPPQDTPSSSSSVPSSPLQEPSLPTHHVVPDPSPVLSPLPSPDISDIPPPEPPPPTPPVTLASSPKPTDVTQTPPPDPTPPGGCGQLDTTAVADWLNSINLGSFFNSGSKYIRDHHECFIYINPLGTLSLWIEPYGYRAHYSSPLKHDQKMDFELSSSGAEIGAEGVVANDVRIGGVVGYFHSNLEGKKRSNTSTINGVYIAPSIEYLFTDGSVALTLLGIGNFYEGERTICTPTQTTPSVNYHAQSWDINMRLESEYTLEPPSDFFIHDFTFYPFIRVDYLNVFELSHQVKVPKGSSVNFEGHHSSYFYSKLGTRLEKIVICNRSGILTTSIDLGWINMSPLGGQPESKNQLALGAGIKGLYESGLLIGLDYSAAVGANSPMQTIKMRLEWNW